jgi:hypothetical protein
MNPLRSIALAALALLTACDKAPEAPPTAPEGFKVRLTVEPAAGGGAQRLLLPAQALIAIERADLGDVRLFDGRGKTVPLARDGAAAQPHDRITLDAIPLKPGQSRGTGPTTIRIDNAAVGQIEVSGGGTTAQDRNEALFDTRRIDQPAVSLTLDAQLPLQRPVTVTLETSGDLASWEPLAEKVLLRAYQGGEVLGPPEIALGGATLKNRYLKVSWSDVDGVEVRGAAIDTASAAPPPRVAVQASGLALESAHRLRFSVPFGAPLAALRLIETGPDGVVPLRLYGRNHPEETWTLLGAGIARPGDKGSTIDLGGTSWRDYRIEADARSAGFAAAPGLELLLEPVELVAAFNDAPPYVLAVGSGSAAPAWFAADELIGNRDGTPAALPLARVDVSGAPAPAIAVAPPGEGPLDPRKLALWGALVLGTAILALAAIRLMRANAPGADQPGS